MKVVFLQDLPVQKVRKDDVREVADGYARNFLFPKKLAVPATSAALQQIHAHALKHEREQQRATGALNALKQKLEGLTVEFKRKAHEGKLYGGIHTQDILEELKKRGVILESKQLKLEHPLKMLGEHSVRVRLEEGIETAVKVRVSEEISN
jgi:large subunit ribosomal protein L9